MGKIADAWQKEKHVDAARDRRLDAADAYVKDLGQINEDLARQLEAANSRPTAVGPVVTPKGRRLDAADLAAMDELADKHGL